MYPAYMSDKYLKKTISSHLSYSPFAEFAAATVAAATTTTIAAASPAPAT